MNIDQIINSDISLESLIDGSVNKLKDKKQSINDFKFVLKTNDSFKNSIVDKDCKDHLPFAIESMMLYGEAEQFGTFATESLHSMNNEYQLMVSIANKYGIENFNPYKFGLEEDKKDDKNKNVNAVGGAKRASLMKRIWAAIVTAFQRLIASIGNFMRSIMNWFASNGVKKMTKFYEENKEKLAKVNGVKNVEALKTKKFKIPVRNVFGILKSLTVSVDAMTKVSSSFDNVTNELSSLIKRLEGNEIKETSKLKDFFRKLKGYKKPEESLKAIMDPMINAVTFNSEKVKEYLVSDGNLTMKDPSGVASILFYGSTKPEMSNDINQFIKNVPFGILSEKAVGDVKNFVNNGKKATNALNESFKSIRNMARQAEEIMAKKAQGNAAITQQALDTLTKYGNMSRRFNSFMVGIILNIYKEFMKIQSYSYNIAKTAIGNNAELETGNVVDDIDNIKEDGKEKKSIKGAAEKVGSSIKNAGKKVKDGTTEAFGKAKKGTVDTFNRAKKGATGALGKAKQGTVDAFGKAKSGIDSGIKNAKDKGKGLIDGLKSKKKKDPLNYDDIPARDSFNKTKKALRKLEDLVKNRKKNKKSGSTSSDPDDNVEWNW